MTLQQLEYVVALDREKNFVRAADLCFVTQPTLSMQLHKLENEIGFRIFDRSVKPLEATELGRHFIDRSRQIIDQVDALKILVNTEIENLDGEFRVGIIPTLASYLLPLLLPEITKYHENTVLIIEELQSEEIIARLEQDRLDLAFMSSPLDENDIREIPLFSEPFLLYLSVNHPLLRKEELVPDDLDPKDLLLLSEGHCFRNQALNLCNARGKTTGRGFYYESGSIETLKGLVDRKMGYTLVPELSVIEDLKAKPSIRRFKNPEPIREISLVSHERFSREKLLEVIRDIVQRNLPENLTRGKTYARIPWK